MSVRDGGYRPIVFLQNGLWLAIFLCVCAVAALALWRLRVSGGRWLAGGLWLMMTLVLCHSLGALGIGIAILPLLLLVPARGQLVIASLVATVIVLYPMLRTVNLVPVELVASLADSVNSERAGSLQYRLNNENILLAHANARPLAGWGIWGRSRVYSEKTGADISITDGMWIITIGTSGWLGYVALFGLLAAPAVVLALQRRRSATLAEAGLALALTANLIDLIPNATLTPVTWLIAGGLAGGYAVRRPAPASTRTAANVRRDEPSPQHAKSWTG
jgi:hypothetical protein